MTKRNHWAFAWPLLAALVLFGCGGGGGDSASPGYQPLSLSMAGSSLPWNQAPAISTEEVGMLVAGNNEFAWNFYREWVADSEAADKNLIFSPFSISTALAMTHLGAGGETAGQMAETLRFTLAPDAAHRGFNALLLGFEDAERGARVELRNGVFVEKNATLLDSFLDGLAVNYGADAYLIDTATAAEAEASRQMVNQWVEQQTHGRIVNPLAEGALNNVRLALANTAYFKGAWRNVFSETGTAPRPFTRLDGSVVQADTMYQDFGFAIMEHPQYVAVSLPYEGDDAEMVLVMPHAGQFGTVEQGLFSASIDPVADGAQQHVLLHLPKFRFSSSLPAKELLKNLGMVDAFTPFVADFSGMDGTGGLHLSSVSHGAAIALDEQGTEAAAATTILGTPTNMSMPPVLSFDRPFLFFIRDTVSGTVLFVGRVLDPTLE